MNVVIRVDASVRIGLGHLARCRTLAAGLRERGASVRFICRAHPGHQIDALRADGYSVSALPAPPARRAADGDYAAWLGVPREQDAAESLAALAQESAHGAGAGRAGEGQAEADGPDWLVIDHYGLDADWEQALRPWVGDILVIDDLANRQHDCDLLLDQNFADHTADRYRGLLPAQARMLLGPTYALLRPEYAEARQDLRLRDGNVRRVLVFFGGTDPENLSGRALEALIDPDLAHLGVDIVVGVNNPHAKSLATRAAARPNTLLHSPRPHLADLMAAADLAIGAGGATTWERCCLGLPSLVASIADNQRSACEALAEAGVIDYLGQVARVTVESIRAGALRLIRHPEGYRALAAASSRLVDGAGTQRVVDAVFSNSRSGY